MVDVLTSGLLGLHVSLGLDGMGVWLVLLVAGLCPVCAVVAEWPHASDVLWLLGIVCAATSALDAVTFYVMLEATVVPLWMTIAGRSAGGFADPLWRSCRPLR